MKYSSRHPRILAGLALAAATTLGLTACGGSAEPGASDGGGGGGEQLAVTLITKTATNPFFIAMQQGAEEAGQANNVDITNAAGKEDGDEATQIQAIEAAIARGDDGILITPATEGVEPAMQQAKDAGLYVIVLDTPPTDPASANITFATDNFKAGELIGQWAAGSLKGEKATIALLDLFNDRIASVDYNRDQGFLTGMGIDVKDERKNGDEDETGRYTGGQGGDYEIVCNEPTNGAQDRGRTAMETCLNSSKDINLVYTINEPAAVGASEAIEAAGLEGVTIVSVDGGCSPGIEAVEAGTIGATSQQYPVKMAQLGVEAIAKYKSTGEEPAVTPGLDFFDTGVALVTGTPVDGVESIDVAEGQSVCWGK